MIVRVSKKQEGYSAFCAELVDVISTESYLAQRYGTGECTDEDGAEYVFDEFCNMLRDIIGWYKYEGKVMPEILQGLDGLTIQFNQASYNSCFYDHPNTEMYNIDETPSVDIKKKKQSKARSDRFKTLFFPEHETLTGNVLVPDLDNADPSSPFYDKKVVFTGVLESISRGEAADIVKSMGADINSSISGSTDYVIVGSNAGPAKLKKIEDYNAKGANIQIINESKFLEMIK